MSEHILACFGVPLSNLTFGQNQFFCTSGTKCLKTDFLRMILWGLFTVKKTQYINVLMNKDHWIVFIQLYSFYGPLNPKKLKKINILLFIFSIFVEFTNKWPNITNKMSRNQNHEIVPNLHHYFMSRVDNGF